MFSILCPSLPEVECVVKARGEVRSEVESSNVDGFMVGLLGETSGFGGVNSRLVRPPPFSLLVFEISITR